MKQQEKRELHKQRDQQAVYKPGLLDGQKVVEPDVDQGIAAHRQSKNPEHRSIKWILCIKDDLQDQVWKRKESCRHCQSLEAKLRSVSALLNESPELPVPDLLSQRITAAVSERMRQHSGAGLWGLIGFIPYRYRAAVTTAVLAIGLCIGGLAGHNIAGLSQTAPVKLSYDLLTLGGIGAQGESVAFNAIWQDNGDGGRP